MEKGASNLLVLRIPVPSKTDEFSEKFQTAVDPPPPHFWKIMLRIFFQNIMTEVPCMMAKIYNIIFWIGNDAPPPSELFQKFIRF